MPFAANIYYQFHQGDASADTPAVVLLHGAAGNHLSWHHQIRRLPGVRVYALDLPGHGKSTGHALQSISAYASQVVNWMISINLARVIWVGHSMGSAIALNIALDHPESLAGLGLIGAGARLSVNPMLLESASNPASFHKAIETIVSWSFSPDTPAQLVEQVAHRMAQTRPSVLHGDLLACDSFDERERIRQVQAPTLVICGAEDRMTPPRYAQYLADNISSENAIIIPAAGHMVMLEQPIAVVEALLPFIRGISTR